MKNWIYLELGYIGLNNIRANDYVNVVVQALSHIAPFRNFFMNPKNYAHCNSSLGLQFSFLLLFLFSFKENETINTF